MLYTVSWACEKSGRGVLGAEYVDLTAWIMLYISRHNYVLCLDLIFFHHIVCVWKQTRYNFGRFGQYRESGQKQVLSEQRIS